MVLRLQVACDTLHKVVVKGVDKRLGMELACLRQYLWRRSGEPTPDRRMLEEQPPLAERTDYCRWVGTTVMACDCLAKRMREDFLQNIIDTNVWNYTQTSEAKAIKARKAAGIQRRKQERKEAAGDTIPEEDDEDRDEDDEPDAEANSS